MKHTYEQLGRELGVLVERKQRAYGDSFGRSAAFLRLLYPHGILPAQYDDVLVSVRIFDKLARLATGNDPDGESPYQDIAGYGLLGVQLANQRAEERKKHECPGSVSDQDARNPSEAQPDSAAETTSSKTTTSANAKAANAPSQPHASCSPDPASADASTAMDRAKGAEDVLVALYRNRNVICGSCFRMVEGCLDARSVYMHERQIHFCSGQCMEAYFRAIGCFRP